MLAMAGKLLEAGALVVEKVKPALAPATAGTLLKTGPWAGKLLEAGALAAKK